MALRAETSATEVKDHGGSLARARRLFPAAPEPWVDLSTGINPHSYPLFRLPATAFQRLPEPGRNAELCAMAARAYGAPAAKNVVAAPGTQILLPRVAALVALGKAAVLGPTYAEHARAAAIAGHQVSEVQEFGALAEADLAILVNPNNPDGRVCSRTDLLDLANSMSARGGLLVVDEAFMDVGPRAESLASDVEASGAVVLRSFGKFFGLAGVRLGFVLAPSRIAARLAAELGPWAVAGPTLEIGLAALADVDWQAAMREKLGAEAAALDATLARHGIPVVGGTSLFRFVKLAGAQSLFQALGARGILVRNFLGRDDVLRIGLPANPDESMRLEQALAEWATNEGEDGR